jgi:DNA-binding transcriptional LysR family regulator
VKSFIASFYSALRDDRGSRDGRRASADGASWGTRLIVDRAFAEARIDRRVASEVSDLGTLLDLVARGLGIALVPETLAGARPNPNQQLPIGISELCQPEICWELVLAYAAGNTGNAQPGNSAANAFIDVLRKARSLPEPCS